MQARVLVAYGSRHGSTAEIAGWVGDALRESGLAVDVVAAPEVREVARYDAVVVGGALYASIWHADARRFVRRHARELRAKPVWLFSSGPLDDSADEGEIAPVPGVRKLAARIGARGHVTFGGRLAEDVDGFLASRLARKMHGDWRRAAAVRAWAASVASELSTAGGGPAPAGPLVPAKS